jgi:hypothetical protein
VGEIKAEWRFFEPSKRELESAGRMVEGTTRMNVTRAGTLSAYTKTTFWAYARASLRLAQNPYIFFPDPYSALSSSGFEC